MNSREAKMEKFIMRYKAAAHAKLTRQELAYLLGVKADSVRRRRLAVYHHSGLDLPLLADDPTTSVPGSDEMKKYATHLKYLKDAQDRFTLHEPSADRTSKPKRYVVTAAQNATPVHQKALASLLRYCDEMDAELIVIPYRYKNPTSIWTHNNKNNEYWDTKITSYIQDIHLKLNDHFRVMGHIKIQPTAVSPLSGFDAYTGEDSAVFGHPSVELKAIPTPAQKLPKVLSTTGSITVPNYTDSKAGHKGEFNHSLAALVVEIDGDKFYQRHIHFDDDSGAFYDLDRYFTPEYSESGHRVAALVTGDIHAEFHDPLVEKATYLDEDSIMNVLNPEVWAVHDLEDFYARNHHHRGNDLLSYGKHHFGRNNVEESLQLSADFVDKHSRDGMLNLVVKSNHDEALDRWLREGDPKTDPENATFFHYMKYHQYKNLYRTSTGFETIDPFEFWCKNPESQRGLISSDRTRFLKRDESFVVKTVEIGFHGDIGPNGSRGSIRNLSKIGPKLIIGHSHCLARGHSILTKDKGWIPIDSVEIEDYVLSYNKDDYNEYVRVDKTLHFKHSGKMIQIGNGRWVQEVTDYHNMYLRDHTYLPVTAAIVTRAAGEVPLSAKGLVENDEDYLDIDDRLIKQIVAVCADGSIQEGKWLRFQLKKSRKIDRLLDLFGDDLLPPHNMTNKELFKVSLKTNSPSYNNLRQYIDFSDKHLPECLKKLSADKKELLLSELQHWDGTHNPDKNGKQFSTSDKREAELLSSIITELGYRNTCKLRNQKGDYEGVYHLSWCLDRDYIFSSSKDRNDKDRIASWRTKVKDVVDEDVFCVVNKNSNFWVRHDKSGTVSLTGNSPGIFQGVYQVGLSALLNLEYASGPSSWLHTHCIVYPDGHRTLVHVIKGEWKL